MRTSAQGMREFAAEIESLTRLRYKILVDEDFDARLGDFGLASFYSHDQVLTEERAKLVQN